MSKNQTRESYIEKIRSVSTQNEDIIKQFCLLESSQQGKSIKKKESPFNLIKKMHPENKKMFENAHTRILGSILQFNDMQFLPSFLDRCCPGLRYQSTKNSIDIERQYEKKDGKWAVQTEKNSQRESKQICRIDCLIWKQDQYAIIIENKINGAGETQGQLDNYIDALLYDPNVFSDKYKTKEEKTKRIWIVYLGGATTRMPSVRSLSDANKAKISLKYFFVTDEHNDRAPGRHLYLASYQDDIIPWLEEDVLPECSYGQTGVLGSVMVYIDYLKKEYVDNQSAEVVFYNSKGVVDLISKIEEPLSPYFWRTYDAVNKYLNDGDSDSKGDIGFFKALHYYFLNHHFRIKESPVNETWCIRTTGAFVHIWKRSWESWKFKTRHNYVVYFELFPYQIDSFIYNKKNRSTITCRLGFKGEENLEPDLNKRMKDQGLTQVGEFIFNKRKQRDGSFFKLNPGRFFESFIENETIVKMSRVIDSFWDSHEQEFTM